jgi:hypothetical protein
MFNPDFYPTPAMTSDNTLLGRCTVAYVDAFDAALATWPDASARRRGVAAVLEHLAAEIIVLHHREPRLSVHELSRLLAAAAQGQEVKA